MEYDNTNRGSLWINEKATTVKHPGERGSLDIDGVACWISAWLDNPTNPTFRSISVEPKDDPANNRRKFTGELRAVEQTNERAPTMRGHLWLEGDDIIALAGWNRVSQDGKVWISLSAEAWTGALPPRPKASGSDTGGRISKLAAPVAAPDPFAKPAEKSPADLLDDDDDLPF